MLPTSSLTCRHLNNSPSGKRAETGLGIPPLEMPDCAGHEGPIICGLFRPGVEAV
jgi:hypothetical protein